MRSFLAAAAVIAAIAAEPAGADPANPNAITGDDLLKLCTEEVFMHDWCADETSNMAYQLDLDRAVCPPYLGRYRSPYGLSRQIVVNYLIAHPAQRHRHETDVIAKALIEAWPCATSNGG